MDKSRNIIRNKTRLVAQSYTQVEGINIEETLAPVARLEAMQMTLAFASFKDFKLFQMDVKNAFLNGFIEEEAYVKQTPSFGFKLDKGLYGLKQAPIAWYGILSCFLIENGFIKGKVDTILFTKHVDNILLVQIYVDDIIFGSTNEKFCKDFESCIEKFRNEYDGRA